MTQEKLSDILGISNETLMKAKDILPTFDLGKMEIESKIIVVITDKPKKVTTKDKFNSGKDKDTAILPVIVEKIIRADGTEIPYNEKMSLWLSSKSLSLGIAKITNNPEDLIGKRLFIKVSMATYKGFGENRCYIVSEL